MGLAEPFALKRSFLELMRHKEALTGVRAGFGRRDPLGPVSEVNQLG